MVICRQRAQNHMVPPDCELSEGREHVLFFSVYTGQFSADSTYSVDFSQISHTRTLR